MSHKFSKFKNNCIAELLEREFDSAQIRVAVGQNLLLMDKLAAEFFLHKLYFMFVLVI
jgi:hypothetical protein